MSRHSLTTLSAFAVFAVAGCNQQAAPAAPDVVVVSQPEAPPAAVVTPPPAATPAPPGPLATAVPAPTTQPPAAAPKVDPPAPTEFAFPADTAGRALPKVVAPPTPAPLPTERFGAVAIVRTPPARVINPEPLAKMTYAPPALLPAIPAGLKPVAPAERVPLDLGLVATGGPARPVLPETPGVTAKARDVNLPPDLAPLGRPVPDRASLDDPTAEPGNAAIVTHSPVVALLQAAFLKVNLPDPFELVDQMKGKVLPAAEPGVAPVPVAPQRPR